jgi:hypothetical protein
MERCYIYEERKFAINGDFLCSVNEGKELYLISRLY